ncbi:MAG: RNA methyltransferase [Defluviicoccus sp.]|nr:RNA methyltransferase [Defluviicoccus sp.]MDE0383320.1 RNA methyltransferase [Defluviicoccus sp.]
MRGYFGIGVEGVSKAMNVGNLLRSAHAFQASFVFTVAAAYSTAEGGLADTSNTPNEVPFYSFDSLETLMLPKGCALVGVELDDRAAELPSFRHPRRAAYVLGMERGSLSEEMVSCCDHLVRIPTRFSLNLAAAGAIVMYDRLISLQRFGARPVVPGGPAEALPPHEFGEPVWKKKQSRQKGVPA